MVQLQTRKAERLSTGSSLFHLNDGVEGKVSVVLGLSRCWICQLVAQRLAEVYERVGGPLGEAHWPESTGVTDRTPD